MKTRLILLVMVVAGLLTIRPPVQAGQKTARHPIPAIATGLDMEFVKIVPGKFVMGCSAGDDQCYDDEKPAHPVQITTGFEIGKYEVTEGQWRSVIHSKTNRKKLDDLPVSDASWDEVQQFLERMNLRHDGYQYRLPSEAEWEYCARAGTSGPYPGKLDSIGWYESDSVRHLHPVGQKQPNAFGLYDTIGNVWEWVEDWYATDYYGHSPSTDPTGPLSGDFHVLRGGSWNSKAKQVRVSVRAVNDGTDTVSGIGFRCVREPAR